MMSERSKPTKYWFPAKTYGWGWGPPITWQGWVVLAIYVVLVVVGAVVVNPDRHPTACIVGLTVLSAAMLVVCYLTGEPLRWRWGERKP